ncbi:MAG: hypothetical protein GXP48_03565 [Acidobacteria bacterium]|nr:hypothetical protein [Acidobacteriota bacterium]
MVRRLGEILLDRGLITVEELHVALEACHRTGGRLGTQLLRRGFIDEPGLLEALSDQFHLPSVPASTLREAGKQIRSVIPLDLQRRFLAVSFERRASGLSVAMVNPRDLEAREEIEEVTGLPVRLYVATEVAILETLEIEAGEVDNFSSQTAPDQAQIPAPHEWDTLWLRPRFEPARLMSIAGKRQRYHRNAAGLAAFPELTPLLAVHAMGDDHALDSSSYRAGLLRARHRDEVGRLLVEHARRYLDRVLLLSLHRGAARGWMANGEALVPEDVQTLEIPLHRPGILADLAEAPGVHVGPIPDVGSNATLLEALGEPAPVEAMVLPVRVKDRVIAFVMGDVPGEKVRREIVGELTDAAERAGVALEILILRRKI